MPDRPPPDNGTGDVDRAGGAQGLPPEVVGPALRMAAIAILVLVIVAGLWWVLSDRDARSSGEVVDAGPQRVQPLDWISFEEPEGAWGYDRISSTTTLGWLGDRSVSGDLANLEVAVTPRDTTLSEVRADYRSRLEAEGVISRVDETDRTIPGTDAAVLISASGTDDQVEFAIAVLLMAVDDRIVTFVMGSMEGGPTPADLRSTVDSVEVDRDELLAQLG